MLSKTSTTRFILRDVSRNRVYGELKQELGYPRGVNAILRLVLFRS
jgi:hypothetical protein